MKDDAYVSPSSRGGDTSRTSDNIVCRDRQVAAPGRSLTSPTESCYMDLLK